MTELDPGIILAGGQINDPGRLLSIQELALKMRGQKQQMDAQNTIKKLFSDPKAYDPTTGQLAPQALRAVMASDPATGMELMKDQAQLSENRLKRAAQIQDIVAPVRDSSLNAYDDVIKAGGSPEQASIAGQKALDEGLGGIKSSGMLSDSELPMLRTKFDYAPMRASALSYKDQQALVEKQKADARADEREADREKHESDMLGIALGKSDKAGWDLFNTPDGKTIRINKATGETAPLDVAGLSKIGTPPKDAAGKWDVRVDKDGTEYEYNPATAEARTLDKKPYTIKGAADKVGTESSNPKTEAVEQFKREHPDAKAEDVAAFERSMQTGRSPNALALQKYLEENPKATSDDITTFMADAKAKATAIGAISKADSASLTKLVPQKNAIEAFENTAIKNGDVLQDLADKVDSTGVPVIERWIRGGRKAIAGDKDVSEFNAQMYLYRSEVAKILTNPNLVGVLSDNARNEVADFLPNDSSAEQIKGVLGLLKGDFGRRKTAITNQISEVESSLKNDQAGSKAKDGGSAGDSGKSETPKRIKYDAQGNPE